MIGFHSKLRWVKMTYQGFILAVLLMSVFKRRLSFQTLYFVKNDPKLALSEDEGLQAL